MTLHSQLARYALVLLVVALLHGGAIVSLLCSRPGPVPCTTNASKPIMAVLLHSPSDSAVQSTPMPIPQPSQSNVTPRPTSPSVTKAVKRTPTSLAQTYDTPSPTSHPVSTESVAALSEATQTAPAPHPIVTQDAPRYVAKLDCHIIKPNYPALSHHREETGIVIINLVIDTHGKIEHAAVKKSSGYPRLDHAARSASLSSTCRPYTEKGKPIRVSADQPYVFSLDH